jgi:hypothetical protein
MPTPESLAEQFEAHRARLRAVASDRLHDRPREDRRDGYPGRPERLERLDLSTIES